MARPEQGESSMIAIWPADVAVPPRAVLGNRPAPLGAEEGQLCLRTEGGTKPCLGTIELLPDSSLGGCWCPAGHPPCGYCTSTIPECRRCGWRDEG